MADESTELASGISAFRQPKQARRHARRYDLGAFIAEVAVPDEARIERTQRRTAGHFTIWHDPVSLLRSVVRITPVEYSPNEEQET